MAIEIERGDHPNDTLLSTIDIVGDNNEKKDVLYVPGDGLFLSHAAARKLHNSSESYFKSLDRKNNYELFISEFQLQHWLSVHETYNKLVKDSRIAESEEYASKCYPGTDTIDPLKSESKTDRNRNCGEVDRSCSSILLSVVSTNGRYLNGSMVGHDRYVKITINSPDRRDLVEVAMSYDQFASFLFSNSHVPCTIDSFWSINDRCVRLREVVKVPDSISDRMAQRMDDRLVESESLVDDLLVMLDEQFTAGKSLSKTKISDVLSRLKILKRNMRSNRDFTIHQAKEEVASIIEQAVVTISRDNNVNANDVVNSISVASVLSAFDKKLSITDLVVDKQ